MDRGSGAWLVRYAPRLATGARGPSHEGMLILPPGSDRMFLHAHPGVVASSPRLDDIHIAMRFLRRRTTAKLWWSHPPARATPRTTPLSGTCLSPRSRSPRGTRRWPRRRSTWTGLADEDPTKPRSAEARYLVPEVLPGSATAGEDATSRARVIHGAFLADRGDRREAARRRGARAAKEERAVTRAAGVPRGQGGGRRGARGARGGEAEAVAGSKAEPVSKTAASARVSAARAARARAERARGSSCRDRCASVTRTLGAPPSRRVGTSRETRARASIVSSQSRIHRGSSSL